MAMSLVGGESALVGTYHRRASGEIKVKPALVFSGVGAAGAWGGAFGHKFVRDETVLLLFGLLMILAVWQIWRRGVELPERPSHDSAPNGFLVRVGSRLQQSDSSPACSRGSSGSATGL